MSTSFEVFPATDAIPTFAEVIERAQSTLTARLAGLGLDAPLALEATVRAREQVRTVDPSSAFRWRGGERAWCSIRGVHGGSEAQFRANDQSTHPAWEDERALPPRLDPAYVRDCLAVGHHWIFGRTMGQAAVTNLAYGYWAAALAELTGGFVFSDDSAWDYARFPATPQEFWSWYFVPELAQDDVFRVLAQHCLAAIPGELAARTTW